MKTEYVEFGPGVERIEPDFDKKVERITDEIKKFISQSRKESGGKYATRDAHAKGYAAVKAEFEILDNLPPELAQGLYARPGRHEAVIRFSNGSPKVTADFKSGLAMGLAIKIFDVPGKTLLEDERDCGNFDYNLINWPIFFCNTAEHYMYIDRLFLKASDYFAKGWKGRLKFMYDWLTGIGTFFPNRESVKEFKAFSSFSKIKPYNTLLHTYYTMGAVRHGRYIAKLRAAPVKEYADMVSRRLLNIKASPEVFRPALVSELQEHGFEYNIQVQLCKDLKKMPVEDLTKEWSQDLSPFITVAKLRIPKQNVSGEENYEIMEHLSFTPFRCLEENRPIGNLQLTRKEAYRISSTHRHHLNKVERKEPASLKDVFPE